MATEEETALRAFLVRNIDVLFQFGAAKFPLLASTFRLQSIHPVKLNWDDFDIRKYRWLLFNCELRLELGALKSRMSFLGRADLVN